MERILYVGPPQRHKPSMPVESVLLPCCIEKWQVCSANRVERAKRFRIHVAQFWELCRQAGAGDTAFE